MKLTENIEWLVPIAGCTLEMARKSNLASIRIRSALCAQVVEKSGGITRFSDGFDQTCPDVLLIGKIDNITDPMRSGRWLNHVNACKAKGSRIVVDYTDHHLATQGPNAQFYQAIIELADIFICSSRILELHLHNFGVDKVCVIADPIEVDILPPKNIRNNVVCALWFGHATNFPYFMDFLRSLKNFSQPFKIFSITNAYPLPQSKIAQISALLPEHIDVAFLPWSMDTLMKVAGVCDCAVIPAGVSDPRKSGASANRLLTAMALGLPTFADPLDSYMEFQEFFKFLTPDHLAQFINQPEVSWSSRVLEVQKIIMKKYTTDAIGNQWRKLIKDMSFIGL